MSVEAPLELSQEYQDMLWVLATSNVEMLRHFTQKYRLLTSNIRPKSEPKVGKSRWPAVAKNNVVTIPFRKENQGEQAAVLSADVMFFWKHKKQHRNDRDGKFSKKKQRKLEEIAVDRYSEPFEAYWEVSFALNVIHEQLRRLTTFRIPIRSSGIPESAIRGQVFPRSNAIIPLAEQAALHDAQFTLMQKGFSESLQISPEVAIGLIVKKVPPMAVIVQMLGGNSPNVYVDRTGQEWELPQIDIASIFGTRRE